LFRELRPRRNTRAETSSVPTARRCRSHARRALAGSRRPVAAKPSRCRTSRASRAECRRRCAAGTCHCRSRRRRLPAS